MKHPTLVLAVLGMCCGVAALGYLAQQAGTARREAEMDMVRQDSEARAEVLGAELSSAGLEVERATDAPPASSPPAPFTAEDERTVWAEEIAGLPAARVLELHKDAETAISERTIEYLRARMDSGLYELVGHGSSYSQPKGDDAAIYIVLIPGKGKPSDEIRRADLPKDVMPEVWAAKRRSLWLKSRFLELRRSERVAVKGQ